MAMLRFCCRRIYIKKLFLIVLFASVILYFGSVVFRIPKAKRIWDAKNFANLTADACGVTCPLGQASFYIKTGVENKIGPTICFQNKIILSQQKGNVDRGLNIVVVNDKTFEVVETASFDTYLDENSFIRFCKTKVEENYIVLIASYDEASQNFKEDGRKWMKIFGSEIIDELKFRDSFFLIGQKGLKKGAAIEFLSKKTHRTFSDPLEKAGCFSVPIGELVPVKDVLPQIATGSTLMLGQELKNCGLKSPCQADDIPVMVFTGKESKEHPEICVADHIVMGLEVNDAGRGMNFVVIDTKTGKAKAASHFDTYSVDSVNLELFLENLVDGDIVVAVAYDDASRKLSFYAKEIINKLGSSMIQNLKFRDVWYFIGQKNIEGFTTLEKISYAGIFAEWPEPLRDSMCVPRKIKSSKIIPDPPVHRNDAKRNFCKIYDGYGEFCHPTHVDDPIIKPVGVVDQALRENPVFSSPIVIVPGLNHNALVRTMETTSMQPGVVPKNIVVAWDEKFSEQAALADLFQFRNLSVSSSSSYGELMMKAMVGVAKLFPDAVYLIVLEEELILAPDFLNLMAQCSDTLLADPSLFGVSAFNYNGYEGVSGNRDLLYRVEEFPGLGFMVKMNVFKARMEGNMKSCCLERAWNSWHLPAFNSSVGAEMLVPDVSRIFRQPYEGSKPEENYLVSLFRPPRVTSIEKPTKLTNLELLQQDKYEAHLKELVVKAKQVHHSNLTDCIKANGKNPFKFPKEAGVSVVYYKQDREGHYRVLSQLCKCFGLFSSENHHPKNLHRGLIRFSVGRREMILIGSSSQYAALKPSKDPFFSV